jgi:hypothetical protein
MLDIFKYDKEEARREATAYQTPTIVECRRLVSELLELHSGRDSVFYRLWVRS